jgi:hypothetical protein
MKLSIEKEGRLNGDRSQTRFDDRSWQERYMGIIVIPLSIWGLSLLGLSIIIGALLLTLVEKTKVLSFLSESKRTAVVMVLSLAIGGFIIVKIWMYFNLPLI